MEDRVMSEVENHELPVGMLDELLEAEAELKRLQQSYALMSEAFYAVTESPKAQKEFVEKHRLTKLPKTPEIDWNTSPGWLASIREYVARKELVADVTAHMV
jgi:hypothetical protein